jgi:hypothetical protein
VLAGQALDGATGGELLGEVRQLHPHAKRAVPVGWGDQLRDGDAILEAIEHGRSPLLRRQAVAPPDELFHH